MPLIPTPTEVITQGRKEANQPMQFPNHEHEIHFRATIILRPFLFTRGRTPLQLPTEIWNYCSTVSKTNSIKGCHRPVARLIEPNYLKEQLA
jgi:hypothetical protein